MIYGRRLITAFTAELPASQEDVILIKKSLSVKARRALSELHDKGWKLGSTDSLLKRSHKTGTIELLK